MNSATVDLVGEWYSSMNEGERDRCAAVVGDRIVVVGPRGITSLTRDEFLHRMMARWSLMHPQTWHTVDHQLIVVGQEARTGSTSDHATLFRVRGSQITAALAVRDVESALVIAHICLALGEGDDSMAKS